MTSNRKTDELLIKEFQNGNRSSYTELVNRYRDKIISFLYRYMHDMDAAEDLAQEAFLKYILKKILIKKHLNSRHGYLLLHQILLKLS